MNKVTEFLPSTDFDVALGMVGSSEQSKKPEVVVENGFHCISISVLILNSINILGNKLSQVRNIKF